MRPAAEQTVSSILALSDDAFRAAQVGSAQGMTRDPALRERLEQCGLVFSGLSPDGVLPEIVEMPGHPWFVGVQFHPELKSRPFDPHPLFRDFIREIGRAHV